MKKNWILLSIFTAAGLSACSSFTYRNKNREITIHAPKPICAIVNDAGKCIKK